MQMAWKSVMTKRMMRSGNGRSSGIHHLEPDRVQGIADNPAENRVISMVMIMPAMSMGHRLCYLYAGTSLSSTSGASAATRRGNSTNQMRPMSIQAQAKKH